VEPGEAAEAEEFNILAQLRAVSLPTTGVQLLCSLSAQKREEAAGETSKQVLALASALGPSWRPEGTSAPPSSMICTLSYTCRSTTHLRCMAQSAFCTAVKSRVKDCVSLWIGLTGNESSPALSTLECESMIRR
jgi:hypothetical protein